MLNKLAEQSLRRVFLRLSGLSALSVLAGAAAVVVTIHVFGADARKDAFDIAFLIPRTLIFLAGLDALRNVPVALFARLDVRRAATEEVRRQAADKVRRGEDPSRVFSTLFNCIVAIGGALTLAGILLAPAIVNVVGAGFAPATRDLAVSLTRLLMPACLLIGLGEYLAAVFTAHEFYGAPQIVSILTRLGMLCGAAVGAAFLGIEGLAYGVLAGLAAAAIYLFARLGRLGIRYMIVLDLRSGQVRIALKQSLPVAAAVLVGKLCDLAVFRLATFGPEGTVACYNYALTILAVVVTVFSLPVATSVGPRISRAVERALESEARGLLVAAARWMLIGTAPIAVFCLFGGRELLAAALGHGAFTPKALETTAVLVTILCFGLAFQGGSLLMNQALYARREAGVVMRMLVGGRLVYLAGSWAGFRLLGAPGLAIGLVAGHAVNALIGAAHLRAWLAALGRDSWWRAFLAWSALLAAAAWIARVAAAGRFGASTGGLALYILVLAAIMALAGAVAGRTLGPPEVRGLLGRSGGSEKERAAP